MRDDERRLAPGLPTHGRRLAMTTTAVLTGWSGMAGGQRAGFALKAGDGVRGPE